jgi:hypothetical protein
MKLIFSIMILISFLLSHDTSWAFIPSSNMILHKTVENSGSGNYKMEQEVHCTKGSKGFSTKETWTIANDKLLKLSVTGMGELKTLFKYGAVFNQGNKTTIFNQNKIIQKNSPEFIEKFLHFRSITSLFEVMLNLKVLSSSALEKIVLKKNELPFSNKEARLSRVGGVIAYAFGEPTETNSEKFNPGVWIEQDQFVIRKIKFPEQSEVISDNFTIFPKNFIYPKTRLVKWNNVSCLINVVNIKSEIIGNVANAFSSQNFIDSSMNNILDPEVKNLINEFYKRFR